MVVRGVPHRLAKDAWWLDDEVPQPRWLLGALLALCVLVADYMLWSPRAGLSFIAWVLASAVAVHVTLWARVDRKRGLRAWGLLGLELLPAIEDVR